MSCSAHSGLAEQLSTDTAERRIALEWVGRCDVASWYTHTKPLITLIAD